MEIKNVYNANEIFNYGVIKGSGEVYIPKRLQQEEYRKERYEQIKPQETGKGENIDFYA